MGYKEFVGDTLRELIDDALQAYKKKDFKGYEEILQAMASEKPKDLSGIAKQVSGVMEAYGAGKLQEEKAKEAIERILKPLGMNAHELWPHIVGKDRKGIQEILSGENPVIESSMDKLAMQIAQGLLGKEYAGMWEQMQKWEYQEGAEQIRLKAVLSKRKAHAVVGLDMGVCTATDRQLWDNPDFCHVILFDEAGVAQGGAHILIIDEKGRRYLTLPGINPSMALMNRVAADAIYDKIIDYAQDIAAAMELEKEIWIPTDAGIHSNRSSIQQILVSRGYEKRPLSGEKRFSYEPNYTFQEVYVVPAKVKVVPAVLPEAQENEALEAAA